MMSCGAEVKASSSKKCRCESQGILNKTQGTGGSDEDGIQDQIIIAPEITRKILAHLDLRSLKQVRLVCKSWLLEAQFHMERTGVVRMYIGRGSTDTQSFLDTCEDENKIPGLPLPFQALHAQVPNLDLDLDGMINLGRLLRLPPPLRITNLDTEGLSLDLAVSLIVKVSSSLEYLHLCASGWWENIDPLDPKQDFPKLRHLKVKVLSVHFEDAAMDHFPSLVAWLVNSSHDLETYEFKEFTSPFVIEVDIRNVKAFGFISEFHMNNGTLRHLSSIPFSRLETLQLSVRNSEALMAVVARSYMTLKELDLSSVPLGEDDMAGFPVCPNVEQLCTDWYRFRYNFVLDHFPSLHTMTLEFNFDEIGAWSHDHSPPFSGLKRLRIKGYFTWPTSDSTNVVKFLEKFPSLECLYIETSRILPNFSLTSTGVGSSLNFLKGIKHLVLHNWTVYWSCQDFIGWYTLLSSLTGLESIDLDTRPEIVTTLPVRDLPRLKIIQFSWDELINIRTLLEMTRGMEKVLVSGCCSVLRSDDSRSKDLLTTFFESAPNAECGCKDLLQRDRWFPEAYFNSTRNY